MEERDLNLYLLCIGSVYTHMARVFVVEGEIAAGKSELVKSLVSLLQCRGVSAVGILEPVDMWKEALPRFYEDQARFAYSFQTFVFATRITRIVESVKAAPPDTEIFILERSPMSDQIFWCLTSPFADPIERHMYSIWRDAWLPLVPFDLSSAVALYLRTSLDVCMSRLAIRDRVGEVSGVKADYQRRLRMAHEAFLLGQHPGMFPELPTSRYGKVVSIPAELADGNFRDPGVERTCILNAIVDNYICDGSVAAESP